MKQNVFLNLMLKNSNTTLVKVKSIIPPVGKSGALNSNTTLVKVK